MPFSMSSRKAREHALAEFDENRRAARMLNPVGDENEGETPVAGAMVGLIQNSTSGNSSRYCTMVELEATSDRVFLKVDKYRHT